jgi:hypothetical protein
MDNPKNKFQKVGVFFVAKKRGAKTPQIIMNSPQTTTHLPHSFTTNSRNPAQKHQQKAHFLPAHHAKKNSCILQKT